MQACWYGSFYGDSDYEHSPLPTGSEGNGTNAQDIGMHLWYASDETTFQQYGWRDGEDTWELQGNWTDKNGHAGVGCYSWGPGTVTYTMMVNLDDTVEVWWKDTNTTLQATEAHPINEWTNSSVAINNVHPSTSLGYTNMFYAQAADSYIVHGYNISWNAENTTIDHSSDLAIRLSSNAEDDGSGLPGTHMSVSTLPNASGGDSLVVFYQVEGDDVTEFVRDLNGGGWTSVQLPLSNQ